MIIARQYLKISHMLMEEERLHPSLLVRIGTVSQVAMIYTTALPITLMTNYGTGLAALLATVAIPPTSHGSTLN